MNSEELGSKWSLIDLIMFSISTGRLKKKIMKTSGGLCVNIQTSDLPNTKLKSYNQCIMTPSGR
jgi:hypothetical protein